MLRPLLLMLSAWLATMLGRLRGRPRHATWPFVFEILVRYLRLDWEQTASWDDAALRADLNKRPYPNAFVRKVRLEETSLGGVRAWRFVPPNEKGGRCVLFLHGGSYIYGSPRTTHAELIARIAFESGFEVHGLDFRLAPEHRYPSQLEDAITAFDALVARGIPARSIVIAGDSSGGNLAVALQLALRDRGGPQAVATVLSSPWVDLEMPATSFKENAPFDYGTRDVLARQALTFAAGLPLSDPRISPTHANLQGLSPCLVTVGELEIPRDDILEFAERLRGAGVDVTLQVAKNMPHNAPVFAQYHPEGKATLDAIIQFIQAHLN
jgi:monoterpene epsilon-lactone hydrolase